MSTARKLAGLAAALITIAMICLVVWIWMNWSAVIKPMPIWEMILWAIPLSLCGMTGEALAVYARTGKWEWFFFLP